MENTMELTGEQITHTDQNPSVQMHLTTITTVLSTTLICSALCTTIPTTTTTTASGVSTFCRDTYGCQHMATGCETNFKYDLLLLTYVEQLGKCKCTHGFTGTYCQTSIFPDYEASSKRYTTTSKLVEMRSNTELVKKALIDQIEQHFPLEDSVVLVATIQLNNVNAALNTSWDEDDKSHAQTMLNDFQYITDTVYGITESYFNTTLNSDSCQYVVTTNEDALMKVYQLYLMKHGETTEREFGIDGSFSVVITRQKGKYLPSSLETSFGQFKLPYYETFQDRYKNKYVSVIVLSYPTKPYFFVDDNSLQNSSVVKILTLDDKMMPTALPDPEEDPYVINTKSTMYIAWKDMEAVDSGAAYMAVIKFNHSVAAAIVEIQMTTRGQCETFGKYGGEKPTDVVYDVLVITKGTRKIVKNRARQLNPLFSDQILKLSITYQGDEAVTKPIIFITKCEDYGSIQIPYNGKDEATGENKMQFRVAEVDLRSFNYNSSEWEIAPGLKLKSGQGQNVAFESSFFGSFSADVAFVPFDTIDFKSIFLDFAAKLRENPYGLSVLLSIWMLFILITIPLRRLDRSDAQLWDYAPLTDNVPFARYKYYLAVSTAILSASKFTSTLYINIKGEKNQTGTRLLSDGYRENFRNGTTSHFCLTSDKELGKLRSIKIWHDSKGQASRWLLSKIIVGDVTNKQRFVFSCGKWLSLDSEDGKTYRKLTALDETFIDNDFVFSDLSKRHLFDDHLLFSVSKRPNYSKFTRVQRLWSLAALLHLSMITSAMFYNSPDYVGRSINIGPFTLNYKQFYVGFMSAIFAIVPSLIIMTIFKQRKVKGEIIRTEDEETKGKKTCFTCCSDGLPWWTIFFGYALIAACILSSSFFIFMYSLDWGSALTLDWMFAIFFGTLQSIFLMEPLKAVCLALIMTCCCAKIAQHQTADLNFPSNGNLHEVSENGDAQTTVSYMAWPGDGKETRIEKQYRRRLYLDKRLNSKLRWWIVQLLYTAVIVVVCNHGMITASYYQNNHLKNMVKKSYKVNNTEDIYEWLKIIYAPSMYSKEYYNGDLKMVYQQKFVEDNFHLRMGLSRIRQVRAHGSCHIPDVMQNTVRICSLAYSSGSEDKNDYCKGWLSYNTSCYDEEDVISDAFLYQSSTITTAFPYFGNYASYGGGGYFLDVGPIQSFVLKSVQQLEDSNWIDKSTRAVFVECMLLNGNSRLFSHLKVVFELSHFGGLVHTNIEVTSINLYPYTESWDYVILGLQIIILVMLLVRLIILVAKIIKSKCCYLFRFFAYVRILEITFGTSATIFYIIRIDHTIEAVENIFLDFGSFVPFEMAILMDNLYHYCIGAMCFMTMIDLLKPLSFNFYLHLMKTSIAIAKAKLLAFIFIIGFAVMAFASLLFLIYGHVEKEFRDIPTSLLSLFRMMIGMVSFRQEIDIEAIGVTAIFGGYCFLVTIILMNLFISCLNMAFSDASEAVKLEGKHKFDSDLNTYMWWKISGFCGRKEDVEEIEQQVKSPKTDTNRHEIISSLLDKLEVKAFHQFKDFASMNASVLRTLLLLNTAIKPAKRKSLRCISRISRKETHYMYINEQREFVLVFVFRRKIKVPEIPVVMLSEDEAISDRVYPHITSGTSCSNFFIVNTDTLCQKTGPVDIKIVHRSQTLDAGNLFLLSSSDHGRTWNQKAATIPDESSPCICARFDDCPIYFMAIVLHDLFDLPPRVLDNCENYTITTSGGIYHTGNDKSVLLQFEPDSVSLAATLCLALEPSFPSPMLHLVCQRDVKNVGLTFPQTSFISTTKSGKPRKFVALFQEGCILTWKKIETSVHTVSNGFFHFIIPEIKRGVKISVCVKPDEIGDAC